ncbi:hypothetical protein ACU4GD_13295 [Cupriavidus basilensis]
MIEEAYFDWVISRPYLVLLLFSLLGVVVGFLRLFLWNQFRRPPRSCST